MRKLVLVCIFIVAALSLTPSLFSADLTRSEIERIANEAAKGIDAWSNDIAGNMQKPLQGDSPLSGLDGKPLTITTQDGKRQTIDAGLECAKTQLSELVKVTAKADNVAGGYSVKINTNIEGASYAWNETIGGLCPNSGYVVCSNAFSFSGSVWTLDNSCKAYKFTLTNAKRVSSERIEAPNGCLCFDSRCGGSYGVNSQAVAQEIASVVRSLINKAYPHLVVTNEQAIGSDSYAYYISQEPTCGSKVIAVLPSNDMNRLDNQARALRSKEIENDESDYSLVLAMDKGKEEARLNEGYQQAFNDLRARTDEGLKSVTIGDGTITYTDYQKNDSGEWIAITDSMELADLKASEDRKTCVVSIARKTNELLSDGTSAGVTTEYIRESRYCDDNDKCPIVSGETIASGCSFSNGNQGQVLSTLASLDEVADDLKCNGREPSQTSNCNIDNITIFNGESRHCSYNPVVKGLENCCGDDYTYVAFRCSNEAIALAAGKKEGRCLYIGSYCSSRTFFGTCTQRRRGYCCFKSKLAKIIQEQGRRQVAAYYTANPSRGSIDPNFGSARNPDCRGFTSVEFQVLDFSKIDLSAFFGDIKAAVGQERIDNQLNLLNQRQQNAGWRDNMQEKANDDKQQERMEDAEGAREGR